MEKRIVVKEVVLQVLSADVLARIDDRRMIVDIYNKYGVGLTPEQVDLIMAAPSPGSMIRARAKIQNDEQRLLPYPVRRTNTSSEEQKPPNRN